MVVGLLLGQDETTKSEDRTHASRCILFCSPDLVMAWCEQRLVGGGMAWALEASLRRRSKSGVMTRARSSSRHLRVLAFSGFLKNRKIKDCTFPSDSGIGDWTPSLLGQRRQLERPVCSAALKTHQQLI